MSDAALLSEDIIALFSIGGKTMIGKFIIYPAAGNVGPGASFKTGDSGNTGIFSKLMGDDAGKIPYNDYYFVKNPAEIDFTLSKQATGTAKLTWDIKPFIYGILKQDGSKDVVVAYPKASVAISDALDTTLTSDIVNAYKEII